ncbi:hypothetical protein PCANB_000189 [Pneumocystis canis]|nr:hypothetical protein PCANB_000189 [Pneumocystis canis]
MIGLVNYSDSDEDVVNYSEKDKSKFLKRKRLNGAFNKCSSLASFTKENIRKLPRIDKKYEDDEDEKTVSLENTMNNNNVGLSSLLPPPKNNFKMTNLSKKNEIKKSDIKYSDISHSAIKNINKELVDVKKEKKLQKVSFFSLNIEKPDLNEFEQTKSDSSSYVPMFVKKADHSTFKYDEHDYNVKSDEKNIQNVHCSEIYRVDENYDFLEYTYPLSEEKKESFHKKKDMRIYGKRRSEQGPINFLEVDGEKEYNTNEIMREKGLLVEAPQPIRSIGAGRHQITTLLNSAISQREVFEESFAANRETKRQSGKKYGF